MHRVDGAMTGTPVDIGAFPEVALTASGSGGGHPDGQGQLLIRTVTMDVVEPESPALPPPVRPAPPRYRVWRSPNRVVAGRGRWPGDGPGVALWTAGVRRPQPLRRARVGRCTSPASCYYRAGPDGPAPLLRRILGVAIVPAWLLIAVADGRWKIPDGSLGLALLLVGVALSLWSPGAGGGRGATSGSRPGGR